MLEMFRICKKFPGVTALDSVDFAASRGEVVAVVGENGAGKSTLMKSLAGIHRPDSGTINLDGKPVFMLQRHEIENRDATEIAKALTEAFDQFCVKPT